MTRAMPTRPSSILLVEDEALIRMMLAGMVDELGHQVIGEASSIGEACLMAESTEYDLAMLDVNVGGRGRYSARRSTRQRRDWPRTKPSEEGPVRAKK
jgi:CheY-like chemotaxis protein